MKIQSEKSVESSKTLLEIERENLISVRVLFLTMFLSSVGFSITLPSIWPYLKVLDKNVTKGSLGIVVAIFSIGQLFGGIIFGVAINMTESFKKPLIVSIVFMFFGNIFYAYLLNFKNHGKSMLILSRFIVGFGSGNVAISRTFVTAFSKPEEKTSQIALMSAFQGLGFIFGPCIQTSFIPLGYPGVIDTQFISLNMFTAAGFMGGFTSILNIILLLIFFYDRSPFADYVNEEELNIEAALLKKLLEKSRFGELTRTVMTLGKSVNAMESFLNRTPASTTVKRKKRRKGDSSRKKKGKIETESIFVVGVPAHKFKKPSKESAFSNERVEIPAYKFEKTSIDSAVSSEKALSSIGDLDSMDETSYDAKGSYIIPTKEIEKEDEKTFFPKEKDVNSRFAFLKKSSKYSEDESQRTMQNKGSDFQDNGISIVAVPKLMSESKRDTESTQFNKEKSVFKSIFDTNISEVMTQMLINPSVSGFRRNVSFPQNATVYSSYLFSLLGSFVAIILNNSVDNSVRSGDYKRQKNSAITKSEYLSSTNSIKTPRIRTPPLSPSYHVNMRKNNDPKSEHQSSLNTAENYSNHSRRSLSVCRTFAEKIRGKEANQNKVVCCPRQPGKVDLLAIGIILSILFASMVLFSSLETILTPMLMDNFAFELTYASLIASLDLASCGLMGIFIYVGLSFSTKRISNRIHLILGQVFCSLTCFILIPLIGKPPIPRNNGTTGCPEIEQIWCKNTPALSIYALLISLFTFTFGYAICSVVTTVLFSLSLGPGSQAIWMGFFTAVGSLSRIVGPFYVTSLYAAKGLPLVFGVLALFNLILLSLIFLFFDRIVPFQHK